MRGSPPIGSTGEQVFAVEPEHVIEFPGTPAVLSTPSLIWFLEHAAIQALNGVLEAGEISVGSEIDLQHRAPTPLGQRVVCVARVVRAEGPKVIFQVEARDGQRLIARGSHTRFVVRAESFTRRVGAKADDHAE